MAAPKSPAAEPALRVAVEPQNGRGADYEFFGRHLLASYVGCDPAALADSAGLKAAMERAIEAAGATLIRSVDYSFSPNGMTAVMLLAESHASIHTYPEHQACFVDLFTCGRGCSAQKFDAMLCQYLRPTNVQRRTVLRHADGIEEASADAECWLAEWAA
jgi:S-adenosylmethionine decarboxylase